jgi:thymidylate synthase ThyX
MKEAEKTKILHEYNKMAAVQGLPLAHSYDKAFKVGGRVYDLGAFIRERAATHADGEMRELWEELYKDKEKQVEWKKDFARHSAAFQELAKLLPTKIPKKYDMFN